MPTVAILPRFECAFHIESMTSRDPGRLHPNGVAASARDRVLWRTYLLRCAFRRRPPGPLCGFGCFNGAQHDALFVLIPRLAEDGCGVLECGDALFEPPYS